MQSPGTGAYIQLPIAHTVDNANTIYAQIKMYAEKRMMSKLSPVSSAAQRMKSRGARSRSTDASRSICAGRVSRPSQSRHGRSWSHSALIGLSSGDRCLLFFRLVELIDILHVVREELFDNRTRPTNQVDAVENIARRRSTIGVGICHLANKLG